MSRCSGPVFAVLGWSLVSHWDLSTAAAPHIGAAWTVHMPGHAQPIKPGDTIWAKAGTVFSFMPCQSGPAHHATAPPAPLVRANHDGPHWLVMRSHVTRVLQYPGELGPELLGIAAQAFGNDASELMFGFPTDKCPLLNLVYKGRRISGLLAAEARPEAAFDRSSRAFVFYDLRQLGEDPAFRVLMPGWSTPEEVVAALGIAFPSDFRLFISGLQAHKGRVLLHDGCTVAVGLHAHARADDVPSRSCSMSRATGPVDIVPSSLPAGDPGATQPGTEGPNRYDRDDREPPDAHAILGLHEPAVREFMQAGFLVLMPEYKQEVIQLALRAPCSLEDALAEISDARSADNSERFDCLVPAFPQPDISFGTVLAVPEWASVFGCCVVADLRLVDNRLFAYLIKGRLNRSSLLLQLGVPDATGLRVYLGHTLMQEIGLYTFQEGLTISVVPAGRLLAPKASLSSLLEGVHNWIMPCPIFTGSHQTAFLVLHEGGHKIIPVDVEEVRSSQEFKAIAVETLRFELSRTTVCPSLPRLTDLAVSGVDCKAALVVTESVSRIPIPPGRPPGQRIVIVDQRPILRGITWLLVPGGLIDIEAFLEPLSQQAPTGYCAIVARGLPADATDLHHVRLTNGTLLTVTYVLNGPGGSSEPHSSDDSDMDSESPDSQEPSEDDTTTPAPDDAERAVAPPASTPPGRTQSRSRSRSRNGPNTRLQLCGVFSFVVSHASFLIRRLWGPCPTGWTHMPPLGAAHVVVFCSRLFSLPGTNAQKLLEEPTPTGALDLARLDALEFFAREFGLPWRYAPAWHVQERLALMPPIPAADTEQPELVTVCVAIAVPGYELERLNLVVLLPTDVGSLLIEVQASRVQAQARRFPHLVPVLPQPDERWVLLAALPAWDPQVSVVVYDTRAWDGRIFAEQVPDFMDHHDALRKAGLSINAEVDVHTALDPSIMLIGHDTRIFPGQCLIVRPTGSVPPVCQVLDSRLCSKQGWAESVPFPAQDEVECYCCVTTRGHQLYTPEPARPWAFRQDIAECCGIRADVVQILPARPRITDCAVLGRACRAVLLVCTPLVDAFPVLVDCRCLMQGFTVIWTRGIVDLAVLTADIGEFTPLFWEVLIIVAPGALPVAEGRIQAEAGQVFTAVYRPQSIDEAMDPLQAAPGYSETPTSLGGPDAPGVPTGAAAASSSGHGDMPVPGEEEMSLDNDAEGDVALSADGPMAPRLHFLILSPEYSPDLVSLPADVPLTVADVLNQVSPLRAPTSSYRFPRLQPVHMQPVTSFACLLALPAWEVTGVPILIVSYASPFRVMAAVTGALLASDDILRLIGAAEDGTSQVFFSDVPWALPEIRQVRVQPGDLFTVFTNDQPRMPPVALQALLASADGWHYDPVLPGPFVGAVWVLTTTGHLRVPYDYRPDLGLPEAVSQLVRVAGQDLTFLPAHPPIQDRYRHGMPLRQVYGPG